MTFKNFTYLLSVIILASCNVRSSDYWRNETKKIEDCRSKWIYKDLQREQELTVLLFSPKKQFDLSFFPNLVIGLTETKDTIAFIDKDFENRIEIGSKIKLLPFEWTEVEKEIIKPAFMVHKKLKDNDLYCAVREVYLGKMLLISN